jgi:light-regulated signal transduction histidine kinase (bacteriophytochrome)
MDEALSTVEQNLGQAIVDSGAIITHDPLPTVMAEPIQMMELMQNLIANALKFRRPHGSPMIHVSATTDGEEWTISVRQWYKHPDGKTGTNLPDMPTIAF